MNNSYTYCTTLLKYNLEDAINRKTKIFDKSKLNIPSYISNNKTIFHTTAPNSLIQEALEGKTIQDYSNKNTWGYKIKETNKLYLRNDYIEKFPYPYCPKILGRWDFVSNNKYKDLVVICFKEENYKIDNTLYYITPISTSPAKIKIEMVLGIKEFKFIDEVGNKEIIYEDISKKYFD